MKLKLAIQKYTKHVKTYLVEVDPNTLCSGVLSAIAQATNRNFAAAFSRAAVYTKRGIRKFFHIKELIRVAADPIKTIGKYLTGDHKSITSNMIFDFRVFTITYALAISRPFAQLFDPMIFTCNEELDALQAIQLASDALVDLVPYFTSMRTCDDEVPRPVKRARNQPEEEEKEESSAIVPFGGGDAKSLILPYLPPHLASNKQFVSFAAMKAQTNKMSVVQFDVWIEKQEAAIDLRRTAKIDELKARATLAHARRTSIIETDVRCGVERVFKTKFDAPCGYECGKTIAIDNFYVLRYGDAFTLCCKGCYDVKCEMANGRAERVKNVDSSNAWQHHHGRNVRALCYICGDRQPKFHFYLDSWEAGHDVAHSKDGDKSPENLAPIHPRCNKDQRKRTFAQYMNGE